MEKGKRQQLWLQQQQQFIQQQTSTSSQPQTPSQSQHSAIGTTENEESLAQWDKLLTLHEGEVLHSLHQRLRNDPFTTTPPDTTPVTPTASSTPTEEATSPAGSGTISLASVSVREGSSKPHSPDTNEGKNSLPDPDQGHKHERKPSKCETTEIAQHTDLSPQRDETPTPTLTPFPTPSAHTTRSNHSQSQGEFKMPLDSGRSFLNSNEHIPTTAYTAHHKAFTCLKRLQVFVVLKEKSEFLSYQLTFCLGSFVGRGLPTILAKFTSVIIHRSAVI